MGMALSGFMLKATQSQARRQGYRASTEVRGPGSEGGPGGGPGRGTEARGMEDGINEGLGRGNLEKEQ